ncbi:hypothetical protein TNCV_305561 [Trichonephila clavipes]|nr:hypothetical protein TNCV_305561 [Trichonephila clavipes]
MNLIVFQLHAHYSNNRRGYKTDTLATRLSISWEGRVVNAVTVTLAKKNRNIYGTENILVKGCTITGVHDQKSSGKPDSGVACNPLGYGRFLACHVSPRPLQIFD